MSNLSATQNSIEDLVLDPRNANRGTERGAAMLESSLREFGAGRSILVDKNGVVIAGNKTFEQAVAMGFEIETVISDGSKLVVVQRSDIEIDSPRGRRLAIADNRAGEISLRWDSDVLAEMLNRDKASLEGMFREDELAAMLGNAGESAFDAAAEWEGMPEYENENKKPAAELLVYFATAEDKVSFGDLIGQGVTVKTKEIWHPSRRRVERVRWEG